MKKLIIAFFFVGFLLTQNCNLAFAANEKTTETETDTSTKLQLSNENYDRIIQNNRILNIIKTDEADSINTLQSLFQGELITVINILVGAIALICIFVLSFNIIFSGGAEEELLKQKTQLGWILAGLAMVSVAEFAGFQVFDPTKDIIGRNEASNNFYAKIMQINLFFQYLIGGLVMISCIRSGYNLITLNEGDEALQKEKEVVYSILFGTGLILLSETLITGVIFVNGETMNATQGVLEITGLINFALSFAAGACAIMFVLASFYYVSSMGDEDRTNRAKQIVYSCIFALVIIFSIYTILRFLI